MSDLLHLILNLDESLRALALANPIYTYVLLIGILFTETAFFPIAPFLPGDGLLFTVGVLAASGLFSLWLIIPALTLAAFLGAEVAYRLGRSSGPAVLKRFKWLPVDAYRRAHGFYEEYGGTALILTRFLPIVKALTPFVAGVSFMDRGRFNRYSLIGAVVWVGSLVPLGYFLGQIPFVRDNFHWLVIGLALLCIIGVAGAALRGSLKVRPSAPAPEEPRA